MKKYLLILLVLVTGLSACKKEETFDAAAQAVTDEATIKAYLSANNITTAVKDPSGLYYQVVTAGTGAYPVASSTVTVNYTGKLVSGAQFDTGTGFVTALSAVIPGWTLGLQHVQAGGRINLFIPSALGYANTAAGSIPKSSVLIFSIDLLSFR